MTQRRFLFADLRSVAISACICLLALLELFFNRRDLRIGRLFVVLVTGRADGNRNIGRQSAQAARFCNIDVAGRALHHMFTFAALVTEFDGNSFWQIISCEGLRRLVTSGAVVARRFLILPMTVKTCVMRIWSCLESSRRRHERIRPPGNRRFDRIHIGDVTN